MISGLIGCLANFVSWQGSSENIWHDCIRDRLGQGKKAKLVTRLLIGYTNSDYCQLKCFDKVKVTSCTLHYQRVRIVLVFGDTKSAIIQISQINAAASFFVDL